MSYLDIVHFIIALGKQRQENLFEFKAILVHTVSSRTSTVTQCETMSQKLKPTENKTKCCPPSLRLCISPPRSSSFLLLALITYFSVSPLSI